MYKRQELRLIALKGGHFPLERDHIVRDLRQLDIAHQKQRGKHGHRRKADHRKDGDTSGLPYLYPGAGDSPLSGADPGTGLQYLRPLQTTGSGTIIGSSRYPLVRRSRFTLGD